MWKKYKHPFYEVTPQQNWNTKNEKHQAQWAKYISWNHQKSRKVRLINAFGQNLDRGNSQKALKKITRVLFASTLLGLRKAAPTTNNANYFTRHFELQ